MRIYLDNFTTSRTSASAIQAMLPFLEDSFGLPTSPHQMGAELFPFLEKSYRAIYNLVKAKEEDSFVFTSSSAESITQIIQSLFSNVSRPTGKNHVVIGAFGDAPLILKLTQMQDLGMSYSMAAINSHGVVDVDAIISAITPRTALISLPLAAPLTGVVQPIEEISKLCKLRGILLHVDVTYSLGKLDVDLNELNANYLTFSGDAISAPKGTGGLFAREAPLIPLISGEEEEFRLRGGPLNVPLLIALGEAAQEVDLYKNIYCTEVCRLRDRFENDILSGYPEAKILFQDELRLPNVTTISFPYIRNEVLLFVLSRKGVFASMGGGGHQRLELHLEACKIPRLIAQCALSFSFSKDTSEQEVNAASTIIVEQATKLRRISKVFKS